MAQVKFILDADESKAVRGFLAVRDAQAKVEGQTKKTNRATKESRKSMSAAFGKRAVSELSSYAAGFVGINAAITTTIRLLKDMRRVREEAGRRLETLEEGESGFRQVSRTQKEFNRQTQFRDDLRSRGLSIEAANRATFGLSSVSIDKLTPENVNLMSQMHRVGFTPEKGVAASQILQANFGGKGGAGSDRQIVNKVLAAAGPSPVFAPDIAQSMATSAITFGALDRSLGGKSSDEGLLAAIGVLSESTGKPEAASVRIGQLAQQLSKKRSQMNLAGTGLDKAGALELMLSLPRLEKEGRLHDNKGQGVGLNKFITELRAGQAITALTQLEPKIRDRLGSVRSAQSGTGGAGDLLETKFNFTSPGSTAVRLHQAEDQKLKQANELRFGAEERLAGANVARIKRLRTSAGASQLELTATDFMIDQMRNFGGDRELAQGDIPALGERFGIPSQLTTAINGMANNIAGFIQKTDEMNQHVTAPMRNPNVHTEGGR